MNHVDAMEAMGAPFDFDTNSVEPDNGPDFSEPIPANEYLAIVQKAELRAMRADPATGQSKGTFIEVTFQIADGPFHGRLIWDNMTWYMPGSEKATQIGRGQLKALTDAVGIAGRLTDPMQLVNGVSLLIKVAVKVGQDGKPRNEVKARNPAPYMASQPRPQGQVVQHPAQQPRPQPQQQPQQTPPPAAASGGRRGAWAG